MSEYSYDDRSRHRGSRGTRYREPEYVSETTYVERGTGTARDLVYRPREDSVEDIPRDFPPGEYRRTTYRDSHGPRPRSHRGYDDDYYSDYGHGRRARSRGRDDGYYSDDYERPRHHRRKSIGDQLKETAEGLGLGGVVAAVTGRSRSRSRHRSDRYDRGDRSDKYDDRRSRYSSRSRSRSGSRGGNRSRQKWEQAAKAAIVAGAVEAFRSRKTPGPWTGQKGQRIATAALGAAGIDGLVDKDPDKKGKRHIAESAIGGLVASRLANGPRSRSQSRARGRDGSRSRSRSRARSLFGRSRSRGPDEERGRDRSTIRNVAGAGAVIAAGKAIYDRVRSKSRSRRDRSRSVSSDDSYVPSRGRRYDRSRGQLENSSPSDRQVTGPGVQPRTGKRDSSTSSTSTTDMENQRKKMRGKELLTAGLATVATIHAAHGVYSSMVASEKRRKLVAEGEMTPEEARKRKSKNMLQDAAAVGIAALGIKGAFSEWKEMNEHRHTVHELEKKRREARKKREKRERERREQGYMNPMANPYYAYPAPQMYPTTYTDGNPYAASAVPPPPIGVGQRY